MPVKGGALICLLACAAGAAGTICTSGSEGADAWLYIPDAPAECQLPKATGGRQSMVAPDELRLLFSGCAENTTSSLICYVDNHRQASWPLPLEDTAHCPAADNATRVWVVHTEKDADCLAPTAFAVNEVYYKKRVGVRTTLASPVYVNQSVGFNFTMDMHISATLTLNSSGAEGCALAGGVAWENGEGGTKSASVSCAVGGPKRLCFVVVSATHADDIINPACLAVDIRPPDETVDVHLTDSTVRQGRAAELVITVSRISDISLSAEAEGCALPDVSTDACESDGTRSVCRAKVTCSSSGIKRICYNIAPGSHDSHAFLHPECAELLVLPREAVPPNQAPASPEVFVLPLLVMGGLLLSCGACIAFIGLRYHGLRGSASHYRYHNTQRYAAFSIASSDVAQDKLEPLVVDVDHTPYGQHDAYTEEVLGSTVMSHGSNSEDSINVTSGSLPAGVAHHMLCLQQGRETPSDLCSSLKSLNTKGSIMRMKKSVSISVSPRHTSAPPLAQLATNSLSPTARSPRDSKRPPMHPAMPRNRQGSLMSLQPVSG